MDKIVLMTKWIKDYENLDPQMLKDVIYEVVYTYGANEQEVNSGNPVIDALANSWITQMKTMNANYRQAIEVGKTGGRKKLVDDDVIYNYAYQGLNARQIAEQTGYNEKTIYSSEGWKNRKNSEWNSENSENYFQNF